MQTDPSSSTGLIALLPTLLAFALGSTWTDWRDWKKRVRDNRRNLRALRWELRRVQTFDDQFNWRDETIDDGIWPAPPRVSPLFHQTIGTIDFWMTDAHDDDNSYLVLISVADGCAALNGMMEHMASLARHRGDAADKLPVMFSRSLLWQSHYYDEAHRSLLVSVKSALEDVDRRLGLSSAWAQLRRLARFGFLPNGVNPSAVPLRPVPFPRPVRDDTGG